MIITYLPIYTFSLLAYLLRNRRLGAVSDTDIDIGVVVIIGWRDLLLNFVRTDNW